MKEEWKPDALRETAEEIRSAVMPKSITPEMVGGTLLALTNAVGEVVETLGEIPREHVKVQVRAKDWGQPQMENPEGIVIVDIFSAPGFPGGKDIHLELPIGEGGIVEFDVPYGFQYAVFSKVSGLGASFQYVYSAQMPVRKMQLFNVPVGVWMGCIHSWCNDDGWEDYYVLSICKDCSWDWEEFGSYRMKEGDYLDERVGIFALVSTNETSFALTPGNLSAETMSWCSSRFYGDGIPGLPMLGVPALERDEMPYEEYDEAWNEFRKKAMLDMGGALNTAKILKQDSGNSAALWCVNSAAKYNETRFLPSEGQLYLMWQNRSAINEIMREIGSEKDCLPYQNGIGAWVFPSGRSYEYWWSSTQNNEYCSWVVSSHGFIDTYFSGDAYDVRAVSAFHFEC